MKYRILNRRNLACHVVDAKSKHPMATPGIHLGPNGTESTDGCYLYLCVPYPEQDSRYVAIPDTAVPAEVTCTIPVADATAVTKAVNASTKQALAAPWRHAIAVVVSDESPNIRLIGQSKEGGTVEWTSRPTSLRTDFPEPLPRSRHGELTIGLSIAALERLVRAGKGADADFLELRCSLPQHDAEGWEDGSPVTRRQPIHFELVSESGRTLATGAINTARR